MEKLPYSEGSVFSVPLRNGGYARGVATRVSPEGKAVFGYFFGPKLTSPTGGAVDDLQPGNEIYSVMFGDLGLINGEWQILTAIPDWDRSEWSTPDFVRRDPIGKRAWRVRYVDDDPMKIESEQPIDYDTNLPPNISSGYGAVEKKLTEILG